MMDYVNKKDLKPFKEIFNKAMEYVHQQLPNYDCYYRLVGSAKRNLVLCHHNKGFDLDYQIIFNHNIGPKKSNELIKIKSDYRRIFDEFFTKNGYSYSENSTSAITIKAIDESKIINSFDVVLLNPQDDGLYIFKYQDDEKTIMCLNKVKNSQTFQKNYKKIKGNEMWSTLREIYKNKKNSNKEQKMSFSFLIEAVKETLDVS